METNTLTKLSNRIDTNNTKELITIYNEFVKELKKFVETTKYNSESIYELISEPIEFTSLDLSKSGIRSIKRFKRYLKRSKNIGSINSINKLFHLIYKKILKMSTYSKLKCIKHDKIQKLKDEWKKQQIIADNLLSKYKKERGDFYKNNFIF